MNDAHDKSNTSESVSSANLPLPQSAPLGTAHANADRPIVIRQASPGRRLITWIGWAGFLFCGLMLMNYWSARHEYFDVTEGIRERFHSGNKNGTEKVAVISLTGVIMDGDGFVKRQIDRIRDDEQVKAVVLRVNTPGGTVTGSDYIYHHLRKLQKERNLPLVVSMGSIATSGGYYVSMAVGDREKSIFAEPTTTTGSIGVIIPHYDVSGFLSKHDILDDSVSSHPRKQILSMTRPMSEDDRLLVRAYIDESFGRFKEIVKSGRPQLRLANQEDGLLAPGSERDLATGEIFTASKALEYGLVDEIGFIEEAIERAIELAGLPEDKVRVIRFTRPSSLMSLVGIDLAAANPGDLSLARLLELSTPQAFYLASTFPAWAHSRD